MTVEDALNHRYLDVANLSLSNSTPVWAWSYTGGTNQYWTFLPMPDGSFMIVNQLSGLCLDDPDGISSDGTNMQQYQCWAGANYNQRWNLVSDQGSLYIVGEASGKCLASSADMDGAAVYLWECAANQSEQWIISH